MNLQTSCRALLTVFTAGLLSASLMAPAIAGNTVSKGHGVKCYWVVVSSDPATGSQVLQYVCSRGA
jgi:hypothetical protein